MDWCDSDFTLQMYNNKIYPKVGDTLFESKIMNIIIHPRNKHRLTYARVTLENNDNYKLNKLGWIKI